MAALIRFFSRRKKKDKTDFTEQFLRTGSNSPQHVAEKRQSHKNDIECKVIHLDGQEMTVFLPKKAIGRLLYDRVYTNFDFTQEFDYFGLQYMDTANIAQWLDPTKKIKKQLSIGPPYTLHLKVRFFSSEPQNLRDELTRYLFVMQLKSDILDGSLKCDSELGAELAALSLQSELGDYEPETHTPAFISQYRFMPDGQQTEDFEFRVIEYFQDLSGRNITPAVADKSYLDKARYLADYGVDMHRVTGKDSRVYLLGLTPTGILVYDNDQKIGFFFWPWIITIGFSKNKLKIVVAEKDDTTNVTHDHSFVFTLADPRTCKHLWKCCIECHSFFRLVSNNQKPVGGRNGKFLRLQSRFYSSYRTEFEMRNANYGCSTRRSSRFQRVPSRRFSSRATFEKQDAIRKVGSTGDEPKSKAAVRAERKAETLRRLEQSDSTTTAPSADQNAKPSTTGGSTAIDETPRNSSADTIPRESSSSVGSSSKPHKTVVSVEAKVEHPPKPSVTASVTLSPRKPSVSSSASSSSDSEEEAKGQPEGKPSVGPAPSRSGDDSVFDDSSRAKLVPTHIPMSISSTPSRPSAVSSSRSGFKPTRLQEESTDDESSPVLTRPNTRPSAQVTAQPQVSPSGPSPPPASSLPRPRLTTTTAPPAAASGTSNASLSRIPKISGGQPSTPASPPAAPVSAIPQLRRPSAGGNVPTPVPPVSGTRSASLTGVAGSKIPSRLGPPTANNAAAAPPSGAKAQRSASAASSSSSSSASSASSATSPTTPQPKQEKQEAPAVPPSRIPALPRPARSEIPRPKTSEVKTQFQVETSFASSISTSHKLTQGNLREPARPPVVNSSVVIIKRDASDSKHKPSKANAATSKTNGSTLKEQISTTV